MGADTVFTQLSARALLNKESSALRWIGVQSVDLQRSKVGNLLLGRTSPKSKHPNDIYGKRLKRFS